MSRMIGELWWRRLVNSVRFLDDVQDALMADKSVMLRFNTDIPWQGIMTETISNRLNNISCDKTFDVLDVSNIPKEMFPGEFLMKKYCSEAERAKYWPNVSRERFLAQSKATPLNKRYVCITNIQPAKADEWVSSISEYLNNCGVSEDASQEHGVFILVVPGEGAAVRKPLTEFKYYDYVTDYDCMMLCLTLVSNLSCSRAEKMYLCEVASNITHNNVELAAMLVSEKTELLKDPFSVTLQVYQKNGISVTNLREIVRMAVWESQIKLVFPKLENFRADIIRKYGAKLRNFLPICSSNNDIINQPEDLEVGQLFYICSQNKTSKLTSYREYQTLCKMRDARNKLAHRNTLEYNELKEINML